MHQVPAAAVAHTLPADVASFTGRQAELKRLMRAPPGRKTAGGVVRIVAIDGMAGVGKTALAVHAAHDYEGNGTIDLFAALEVATGKVITQLRPSHTNAVFVVFLNKISP